ncbi:hypothetical protein JVU11DRAFT_7324 [Chiua virens]|nr:hypothetical protein JVU11DRAFT_7324 [Chiua virens]
MGQDCLRCLISQFIPLLQPSRRRKDLELENSDVLVSNESTVANTAQDVSIIRIRLSTRSTRVPVGLHVAVEGGNRTQRTSQKPVSGTKDIVEWDEEIVLPSDPSSPISLSVIASFELESTVEAEEVLREFEITVGELLDHKREFEIIRLSEPSDGLVEIEIKKIGTQEEGAFASNVS